MRTILSHRNISGIHELKNPEDSEELWRFRVTLKRGGAFPSRRETLNWSQVDDEIKEMLREFATKLKEEGSN
jgi:2'-5' RNA ligase